MLEKSTTNSVLLLADLGREVLTQGKYFACYYKPKHCNMQIHTNILVANKEHLRDF